ncbi:UDP-glycosyltransferase UGT5-like [Sitodiplosis mosellana]|uniref:UDP-glycosyltransferase UGT5-like n=1 Tax=Sitodiplosis mosellana TaxID=263140 RepID=UPI002444E318|nr:UDP-glycosyltransferase UGT5-like [Sitodiplosis mosellana]
MSSKLTLTKCSILIALFSAATVIKEVNSYKILGISIFPKKSHFIFFNALMNGLAEDGNEVTFLTPFQSYDPAKNLRHIRFKFPSSRDRPIHSTLDMNGLNCFAFKNAAYKLSNAYAGWAMHSKQFQEFLQQNERFDVVLVQAFVNEAVLSIGHYFDAPIIAVFPSAPSKWTRDLVGVPNLASFPHTFTGLTDKMNFWQRTYNSLCYLYDDVMNPLLYAPVQQRILDSMYPNGKTMPSLEVLKRNVSLVLYNSHPVLETPTPAQPNMIPVAGLFIKKGTPVPLSKEMDTFLNESKGAVYVSFGSNVDFSEFVQSKKDAIINALNEFPEFRIIFKSREKIIIPSHNAANVMIRPWLSQQTILAHEKVKLFITQGGTLSITEAIHFAKPIIGIPIYSDQTRNMNMAERRGYGISVSYEELTTEKLRLAKVLTDPRYAENMQITSNRFRNQIKSPLDTAIYWVKYVAKHKGAPHLRSIAIDMPFYVFYNLDCWAFLIICCVFTIFAFTMTCHILCLRLSNRIYLFIKS